MCTHTTLKHVENFLLLPNRNLQKNIYYCISEMFTESKCHLSPTNKLKNVIYEFVQCKNTCKRLCKIKTRFFRTFIIRESIWAVELNNHKRSSCIHSILAFCFFCEWYFSRFHYSSAVRLPLFDCLFSSFISFAICKRVLLRFKNRRRFIIVVEKRFVVQPWMSFTSTLWEIGLIQHLWQSGSRQEFLILIYITFKGILKRMKRKIALCWFYFFDIIQALKLFFFCESTTVLL